LRDATGLDFGDRSWICNAARVSTLRQTLRTTLYSHTIAV